MTAIDAVGQPLTVGDHVAHVTRHGSNVAITRRVIAGIAPRAAPPPRYAWEVYLVPTSARPSPPCRPYNLIKVRAP